MTPVECVQLIAYVRMRSPVTFIADGTPDAWYVDLHRFDAAAAREAVDVLSRRPGNLPIALGDLLVEIRKVRELRLQRAGEPILDVDPDDRESWRQALIDARKRIADGESVPCEHPALEGGPAPEVSAALVPVKGVPLDDPARVEVRARLRAAAHAKRARVEADTAARREHRERVEAARAELDANRQGADV